MSVFSALMPLALTLASGGQTQDKPDWMNRSTEDRLSYLRGPYNRSIDLIPEFARDMYATGVGHALAYEALVRGRKDRLESQVQPQIAAILRNPPRFMVDEAAISPRFSARFSSLEKVFEWAHTLHFQTIDVLAYPGWDFRRKEEEIQRLWKFYSAQPFALTGLPMNMDRLDGFSWSGLFRSKYPKTNGLFWGYHWLQTANYDMLYGTALASQREQYEVLGDRYRKEELTRFDRDFMPMTAEISPRFARRFPQIANSFDNLHMLHDNVNDILADDRLTESQKNQAVDAAIINVLASTHRNCEVVAADQVETVATGIHDHRHPNSMPGMGWMKGSDGDEMFMTGMGWMDMSECAHCSVSFPDTPKLTATGFAGPYGATVSANGWTMSVRCVLCARDMASESIGRVIIRAATEDSSQMLVLISDEEGAFWSNLPEAVFLDEPAEHPQCESWSRVFTNRAAFEKYIKANPRFQSAQPLALTDWAIRYNGKPETYRKISRPNPYRLNPSGANAPSLKVRNQW